MKIALVSGFWGQNIGNAFFNLGGRYILEAAGHEVFFLQDAPAYWTFRDEAKGNYRQSFPLVEELEFDLLVLQGPLFTRNFAAIWAEPLSRLAKSGSGWAVLSAGFRSYTDEELRALRSVVDFAGQPEFISTRDPLTAEMLRRDQRLHVYGGIDSAFFMPRAEPVLSRRLGTDPYVALCFDHFVEPTIRTNDCDDPEAWLLEYPAKLNALSGRSKAHGYLAHYLDRRKHPVKLGQYRVVRPEHRTNPHLAHKIYREGQALASDEPWSYAHLYANAEATFSDRVHACVLSLAYGTPARLFNPTTQRKSLFSAVAAEGIDDRLVTVEPAIIDEAAEGIADFISA